MLRDFLSNTVLACLITISTWALWSVGEMRIDAYIALYVLEYTVIKALFRPRRIGLDWLMIVLLIVFSIIVSIRIMEVLYK